MPKSDELSLVKLVAFKKFTILNAPRKLKFVNNPWIGEHSYLATFIEDFIKSRFVLNPVFEGEEKITKNDSLNRCIAFLMRRCSTFFIVDKVSNHRYAKGF